VSSAYFVVPLSPRARYFFASKLSKSDSSGLSAALFGGGGSSI
jgi:hypothetical protein